MFKIGDKVKCIKYICYDVSMDITYTVIGVQIGFDNQEFIHIDNATQYIGYDAKHFKKVK